MKRIFILVFLTSSLILMAQNRRLTNAENAFGTADSIVKQQVEYKDPGSEGLNLSWDFSILNPIKDKYILHYFLPNKNDVNHICGLEHKTRYYYYQTNDSLWSTGYENSTTYMEYTVPELRMRFPFAYGDTLYSNFEGKGEYCHRSTFNVKGYTRVKVDAEGVLTLPDGDKITQALRVHTTRKYTQTGKDSLEMKMDIYSWYAKGTRYPVFESIKSDVTKKKGTNSKDSTIYTTSFYYPPIKQKDQLEKDELVSEATLKKGLEDNSDSIGTANPLTSIQILPNPVTDNLYVNFKLNQTTKVWYIIYSNVGKIIYQTEPITYNNGYQQISINMSSQTPGIYTLYIHVGDSKIKKNIIKK